MFDAGVRTDQKRSPVQPLEGLLKGELRWRLVHASLGDGRIDQVALQSVEREEQEEGEGWCDCAAKYDLGAEPSSSADPSGGRLATAASLGHKARSTAVDGNPDEPTIVIEERENGQVAREGIQEGFVMADRVGVPNNYMSAVSVLVHTINTINEESVCL